MSEKQIVERIEKLPPEQQAVVLATVRGMELANEANKINAAKQTAQTA